MKHSLTTPEISLSLDIGHASIGWAVLSHEYAMPELLGCGSVVFRPDDCQNHKRAAYRRMRRNIAARRNRIKHLKALLKHLGVLSDAEINRHPRPHPFPWLLAAQVLGWHKLLTWEELWSVLLWYAHNRGYDGNALWAGEESSEDTDKEKHAVAMMETYNTESMAETVCAYLGVDPANPAAPKLRKYFKGENAAFPRKVVVEEVINILAAHQGKLKGLNETFITCLIEDAHAIACPAIRLPRHFRGGLLFGQRVPRFSNRIIPVCRFSGAKTPSKHSTAYYRYRWSMLLANIRVMDPVLRSVRSLKAEERRKVHAQMEQSGYLTKNQLERTVVASSAGEPVNFEGMFMTPEMEKALIFDPVKKLLASDKLKTIWPLIPDKWQKIFAGELFKGKPGAKGEKRASFENWTRRMKGNGVDTLALEEALKVQFEKDAAKAAKRKNAKVFTREDYFAHPIRLESKASGRAPYSRDKMQEAWEAIFDDTQPDPKDVGGCLAETPEVQEARLKTEIAEQTNNHLVRHRLFILKKLLDDIVKIYARGDTSRIGKVTLEVVRDLQEFSGKTAKEKEQLLGTKLASHRKAVKYIEEKRQETGEDFPISAGLIRKVRIAMELDWTCPFTGKIYCLNDIVHGDIDKEHIIPRALRPSDSLESLVLTRREINAWKGKRTALQFILEEQGDGRLMTPERYREFVNKLKPIGSSSDDKRRCQRRKQLLITPHFDARKASQSEEGEEVGGFTQGDLTQTSHLNKLAALVAMRSCSLGQEKVLHLPGSVTAAVRKTWKLEGTLQKANPQILDETGKPKSKGELREITHLHHALDAVTMGYAATLFPKNGNLWELMSLRRLNEAQKQQFRKLCPHEVTFSNDGSWNITELPPEIKEDIADKLAEQRVVMHVPKTMNGLSVQENTWRVLFPEDPEKPEGKIMLSQAIRNADKKREPKQKLEKASKLLGYRAEAQGGKLQKIKGALIVDSNYGVALDPEPQVIPFVNVWKTVSEIRQRNNGQSPRILRNGDLIQVPQGRYQGTWRVRTISDGHKDIKMDISHPDMIPYREKANPRIKREVLLKTLLKDGMQLLHTDYTGH